MSDCRNHDFTIVHEVDDTEWKSPQEHTSKALADVRADLALVTNGADRVLDVVEKIAAEARSRGIVVMAASVISSSAGGRSR